MIDDNIDLPKSPKAETGRVAAFMPPPPSAPASLPGQIGQQLAPCKPDIFAATYEHVTEDVTA